MYILLYMMLALFFLFSIIFFFKRRCIIKKIKKMDCCQKTCLLNKLTKPLGFCYLPDKDIMTSTTDAWQKKFGYCTLYDKSAHKFNMIFDCESVYFDYDHCTWRIEFWKGQYGINIGCEIGIYKADRILCPEEYDKEKFTAVSENEMLNMSAMLIFKGQPLFCLSHRHWWLTGFKMGTYCEPEDLTMIISITFLSGEMLESFVCSLQNMGYCMYDCDICGLTITFIFNHPHSYQPRLTCRFRNRFAQWQNHVFCKFFIFITRPFSCTSDRLLYLYYYLPICFRHMLRLKGNIKRRHR